MDQFDHFFIAPKNFDQSLAFYKDILQWSLVDSWSENEQSRGAILRSGNITLVLAESHDDSYDQAWQKGYNGHRPTMHLATDDLGRRFAEVPPGDYVVIPPENTHWGTRWFVLKDPDNNLIAFNSPVADSSGG